MSVQKLVLVDKSIKDVKKLTDALQADCLLFAYDFLSKSEDLTKLLADNNVTHVDRIAVVCHNLGKSPTKYEFMNDASLFRDSDIDPSGTKKTVNYELMVNLINTLTPTHVDFLGCELLKIKPFKLYFESLIKNCNNQDLKVGASDNKTGNTKYGGDWVLESTGEDIKNIYFTGDIKFWEILLFKMYSYNNITNYESFQKDFNGNYINENGEIVEKRIPVGKFTTTSWGEEYHSAIFLYNWDTDDYDYVPNLENVSKIYSTEYAYAALMNDGSVFVWGDEEYGGSSLYSDDRYRGYLYDGDGNNHDGSNNKVTGIVAIYSNEAAFAAVNEAGEVFVWGKPYRGGASAIGNTNTRGWLYDGDGYNASYNNKVSGVTKVYSTTEAFAALLSDGRVFVWGRVSKGGSSTYEGGAYDYNRGYVYDGDGAKDGSNNQITNVVRIVSTNYAFAALNASGNIFVWGNPSYGGSLVYDDDTYRGYLYDPRTSVRLSGMTKLFSTDEAFCAINGSDGSVFVWGYPWEGGSSVYDNSNYYGYLYDGNGQWDDGNNKVTGISKIYSTYSAFAAIKESDGSVFVWGDYSYGGSSVYDDETYRGYLYDGNGENDTSGNNKVTGITTISSTSYAFAALNASGSIFVWGYLWSGGASVYGDSNQRGWLYDGNGYNNSGNDKISGFTSIIGNDEAFAAIKDLDGSVFVWGDYSYGGSSVYDNETYRGYLYNGDGQYDTSGNVKITGVRKIYTAQYAFNAVLYDGSVWAWGQPEEGGRLARYDNYNYVSDIVPLSGINRFKYILSTFNYGGMCEMAQASNNNHVNIVKNNETNPLGRIPVELLKKAVRANYIVMYDN